MISVPLLWYNFPASPRKSHCSSCMLMSMNYIILSVVLESPGILVFGSWKFLDLWHLSHDNLKKGWKFSVLYSPTAV
jgi:hypothetical protein